MRTKLLAWAGAAAIMATLTTTAYAQEWPGKKPITLIAPAVPGGGLDTLARALANALGKQLNQTVIVESKPGASGILGLQSAARAAPDGYTYVLGWPASIVSTQFLFENLPFDAKRDFDPVSLLVGIEVVLVASSQTPADNVKDLLAWAKANQGKISYGSYGVGGYGHIIQEYLNKNEGLGATHIPYKGEMPMLMGTGANEVAFGVTAASSVTQFKDSGKIKVIASFNPERSAALPNVPTFKESGFTDPAFATSAWYGLFAPKGVAPDTALKMRQAVQAAMKTPELAKTVSALGMTLVASDADVLRNTWYADIPVYKKLVEISGAKLN